MKTKRLQFVDIARALAIIFIVYGHTIVHNNNVYSFYKLLYSFHIVLFFIISGYIYNKSNDTFKFIKKKFLSLMVPYFIFSLLFLIPYFIFVDDVNTIINTQGKTNITSLLIEIIYGVGYSVSLKQNTSLWFLPALFSTEIIYKLLSNTKFYNHCQDYFKIIILLCVSFISTKIPLILPWGINSALTLLIFFEIGILLKKYQILDKIKNNYYLKILLFIMVIVSIFIYQLNITVSCVDYQYGNYLIFLIVSLSLSIFVMFMSYKISKSNLLELIGKNTLSILILHKLFILFFQTKIGFTNYALNSANSVICLLVGTIVSIITIILSMIIGFIIKKYFPYLYGMKRCDINEKN